MTTFTQEQRREQFNKLAPELQDAILAVELVDKIKDLAKKHALMLDQMSALSDEIGLTMLGLHKSRDFVANTASRLNIPQDKATLLAQDVNAAIFADIRKYLVEETSPTNDSEDIHPDHHEAVRQEMLAAIESPVTEQHVSVNVLGKTQPLSPILESKPKIQPVNTPAEPTPIPVPITISPAQPQPPIAPTTTVPAPAPLSTPTNPSISTPPISTPAAGEAPRPKPPTYVIDPYREPIE